jgi:hypothetical protein
MYSQHYYIILGLPTVTITPYTGSNLTPPKQLVLVLNFVITCSNIAPIDSKIRKDYIVFQKSRM